MEIIIVTISMIGLFVWLAISAYKHESRKLAKKKATEDGITADLCSLCREPVCAVYGFHAYKFIGIAPFAAVSETTPVFVVLCREHAREKCRGICKAIGARGHWGFPGFLVAAYHVANNLRTLRKGGALTAADALHCICHGVLLGWLRIVGFLLLFVLVIGVVTRLLD